MNSFTKLAAVAACGLLVQLGAASADPATNGKDANPCPTGMVAGPDGVCVKQKTGRMGFDLAAPSDDSSTSNTTNAGDTRGIKTSHKHQH